MDNDLKRALGQTWAPEFTRVIRGVHHLVLNTEDMKKTIDFYSGVLGMPLVGAIKVEDGLGTGDDNRGHPGYQGDHIDYCADIIRATGAPNVKLLCDIYHIQIMDGDLIRRIREYGPALIGHIHTAGCPGRGELDDQQEIHYPALMRALVESGYKGYVGHEFIPTRDPREGLAQAIGVCDV